MKKHIYLIVILTCLGCKKKDDMLADVSGKYIGVRSGTDLIGVPNINSSKYFSDTLEIIVKRDEQNYIIQGFDTADFIVPIDEQRAFYIPVNENTNKVNSAFVSFIGDSVLIQGNWRYIYTEGEFTSTSVNRRNYKFVGYRN